MHPTAQKTRPRKWLCLVIAASLALCQSQVSSSTADDVGQYAVTPALEASSTPDGSPFLAADGHEADEWSASDTGMLFIERAGCDECSLLRLLLEDYAHERGIGTIRELDALQLRGSLKERIEAYLEQRGTSFANVSGRERMPDEVLCGLVAFVNKGMLAGLHSGIEPALNLPQATTDALAQPLFESLDTHTEKLGANPCPGHC